jgi:hypothetical protein
MMQWPAKIRDRNLEYIDIFVKRLRAKLATQLDDEIVDRYKDHLTVQPDESLDRLLHFFGSWPLEGRLALLREPQMQRPLRLIRLLSCAGKFETIEEVEPFEDEIDGYIEIFRRRVAELKSDLIAGQKS